MRRYAARFDQVVVEVSAAGSEPDIAEVDRLVVTPPHLKQDAVAAGQLDARHVGDALLVDVQLRVSAVDHDAGGHNLFPHTAVFSGR